MKKNAEKIVAVLSLMLLVMVWGAGLLKGQEAFESQISTMLPNLTQVTNIAENLYEVDTEEEKLYISLAQHVGYAGPMQICIIVDSNGIIRTLALIKSPDTTTYIATILNAKLPNTFIGQNIVNLKKPDAISNATLSSNAIIFAVEKAAYNILANKEKLTNAENIQIDTANFENMKIVALEGGAGLSTEEIAKSITVAIFFIMALFITSKKCTFNKQKARLFVLFLSFFVLGFLYSTQFSFSTIALLLSGSWIYGLASYGPLICLILATLVLLVSKKNLYCYYICPFGALQEGISMITNCSSPPTNPIFKWISRFFALAIICFALYFSSPAAASYEPFGKTFNFLGSFTLFILSASIVLSCLFFSRTWCKLLCPMTPFFDFIQFWRKWLFSKNSKQIS